MSLKVFGTDPASQPKPHTSFHDDVVGRFRSGHQLNGKPVALSDWRVTTGDPVVADKVYDLLGGDAPQSFEAKGEENIEVFTASDSVDILIENPGALRQSMVLWSRNGKLISKSDGETMSDGSPDPDADLTFAERKQKAKDGIGPEPQIELYFRLAAEPDLGLFKFQTGSWSMVRDLAADDVDGQLSDAYDQLDDDGDCIKARLSLEGVEFDIKKGPKAGTHVSYTKPVLKVK